MAGGAPEGNTNAKRGRDWREAIRRAVARLGDKLQRGNDEISPMQYGLDALADKFLEKVLDGDIAAFKEFGDRIDGKSIQSVEMSGAEGGRMDMNWTVEVIDKTNASDSSTE